MADYVSFEQFKQLEARVQVLEREVEGEKLVSRYILEQTRKNSDDLAALLGRMSRVEGRLDSVETELRGVKQDIADLRRDLPAMIAQSLREVLREQRGRE
ncbi:MAG: hypothetical protein ACREC6_00260 [Hyphomicrobiaceae bacterium]